MKNRKPCKLMFTKSQKFIESTQLLHEGKYRSKKGTGVKSVFFVKNRSQQKLEIEMQQLRRTRQKDYGAAIKISKP